VNQNKILIAAGGTGGHIYPALAIAAALKRESPSVDVEFVGTPGGLENQLVPREGYGLHHVAIGRLNRNVGFAERIMTVFRLPLAIFQAMRLIQRTNPRFVLGVGGHVTGPVVLASALLRRKAYLWEPNAHPGLANRLLAPFVDEALVVLDEAARLLKAERTQKVGMPVRQNIEMLEAKERGHGLVFRVLVFGGSQGSRALNDIVSSAICGGGEWMNNVEIVHQTGATDYQRIKFKYDQAKARVEVFEYLHDMPKRYEWADLVVSRSGMGTLAELAACGKAAVLVPLATAADNHQQRNAEALLAKDASIMILQKDFTAQKFQELVAGLKNRREEIDRLGRNIRQFHQPHADRLIARHLLEASVE
jgi:UDP-N-acetylglucosamine--N-acetylmuramyl-(pentapeptide) pyrophosphoryl-undecaprenol N-acetylglucosamine transferase